MKKYIALKDMPFWKEGETKQLDNDGRIYISWGGEINVFFQSQFDQMIKDGWIAEYIPKTYTIEQIEKVWNNAYNVMYPALVFQTSDFKKELDKLEV